MLLSFHHRLLIVLLILLMNKTYAQEVISYTAFIKKIQENSSSYKTIPSFKPNFFTEISVRSQTKDFELKKQVYSVRFSTSNLKTRNYEKQYIALLEGQNELESFQNEKIQFAYLTWMNSYIIEKEQILLDSLLQTINTEKKLLTNLSITDTKLFNDLLKNKETALDIQLKKEVNKTEYQLNEQILYSLLENKDVHFNYASFQELFSTELFQEKLNHNDTLFFSKRTTEIEELLFKERLLHLSQEIEKQKSKKIIDFFQIETSDLDTPKFNKSLSLGIGLLIPRKKSIKEVELAIKKENLSLLKHFQHRKQQEENNYIKLKINSLIEKYILYKKNIALLERHTTLPKANANQLFAFLNSKKNLLEKKLDLLQLEKEILETYSDVFE